jgi:CRISPR-associated protein Cmr5
MQPTRAQKDLKQAYELVSHVQTAHPDAKSEAKKIYSQLCKQFPVMVMQSGLCQTLAFHTDKASKDDARGAAHKLILAHAANVMGLTTTTALNAARSCDAITYMHRTRRILEAWVYFKRFAVSALEIEKEKRP